MMISYTIFLKKCKRKYQNLYFRKSIKTPYIINRNLAEEQKIHYLCHQFETALYEQK